MHNDAGHYAEVDKVATQGLLCRSCSIWYLVAALNAFVSFDQPHSKKKSWTRRYPAARAKTVLAPKPSSLEPGLHRLENVHSQVNFFAWLLHY